MQEERPPELSTPATAAINPFLAFQNVLQPQEIYYKLVFLVRTDLKMGTGKMCAQCGHAVSAALELDNPDIKKWKEIGEKKVALKVEEQQMYECIQKAKEQQLPCGVIRDAGHTQVDPGTVTVGWIGPWEEKTIDQISGHLKLL